MPLKTLADLNDPDIAKELIYALVKLHGYNFVYSNASDARADIRIEEYKKSVYGPIDKVVRRDRELKLSD